ncbi:RlpA-like double-psi beta-barrel-protein domain-containing protein-containing protein [Scleroderma yunnanense]
MAPAIKSLFTLVLASLAGTALSSPHIVRDDGPDFMHGTQYGQGTFFNTGLGACGLINENSEHIAAVSNLLFDNYPGYDGGDSDGNPVCGRQVIAYYEGKSTVVTITDSCADCALTDLDFTPTAFSDLADQDIGRIDISWEWL